MALTKTESRKLITKLDDVIAQSTHELLQKGAARVLDHGIVVRFPLNVLTGIHIQR
jgi:hypothetical protein